MDLFDLVAKITLDSSEYESKLPKLGNMLKNAGKVGAAAIGAATTAVTAFAGASVKVGMGFDKSMSQVAATMGYTVEELNTVGSEAANTFERLSEFAQKMGSETAFSAVQAADALNYMALAGYDADTSMQMLPTVLDLAAAGGIDLARASDMVTDAQSALGLTLEETATMVDQMAAASSKSNTSVEQLGDAFLTIGATARNLSGGTQELSTVLGILADNGIKGAEGGTHLRNAILSLQTPTKDGVEALRQLGMSYEDMYDEAGNMRALPEIFQQMSAAMEGMNQQQKDAIVSGLFNKTDLASINALLGTTSERWDELSGAIGNAEGAAQNMAEVQLDNLSGDITLFRSALEGAQIAISEGLTPDLRKFVQFGSKSIGTLTAAFKEGGFTGAMDALGTILSDGLALIINELPTFVNAGMQLLSSLGTGIINNLPVIFDAALQIIFSLVDGVLENLPEVITAITDVVLAIAGKLTDGETIGKLAVAALQIMIALATGLISNIPRLISVVPKIISNLVDDLIAAWPDIRDAGIELIDVLIEGIDSVLRSVFDAAGRILNQIKKGIQAGWNSLKSVGKSIIDGILQGLKDAWDSVKTWFSTAVSNLRGKASVEVEGTTSGGTGHAIGLDFVPYNQYPAMLHRGEAVLTASEADEWRRGVSPAVMRNEEDLGRIVALLETIVDNGLNANISSRQLLKSVSQENRTRTKATNYNLLAAR